MNITEKVQKSERRDSGRIPKTVGELLAQSKDSVILRAVAVLLTSGAGETLLKSMGNGNAQWWMIAAGLLVFWFMLELKQIKLELRSGTHRFEENERKLQELEQKDKQHVEEHHKKPRAKSAGRIPSHRPPSSGGVLAIEPIG
jgi:hypothetical protein